MMEGTPLDEARTNKRCQDWKFQDPKTNITISKVKNKPQENQGHEAGRSSNDQLLISHIYNGEIAHNQWF
jgi:hypothetical protein